MATTLLSPTLGAAPLIAASDSELAITEADIRAEMILVSRLTKRPFLSEEQVAEAVNELYRRRRLADWAQTLDLDKTAFMQAHLRWKQEILLAQAAIKHQREELRGRIPDMEAYARERYTADPEPYRLPEQLRVAHILLRPHSDAEGATHCETLASIQKRLAQGEAFADLAREFSEDEKTAPSGGELPAFGRDEMVPAFETAAFALEEPGQISPPVTTTYGTHLIQLQERIPGRLRSFEEVRASLVSRLRSEWVNEALEQWRKEVVDPTKAKIDQEALDALIQELGKTPESPFPGGEAPPAASSP